MSDPIKSYKIVKTAQVSKDLPVSMGQPMGNLMSLREAIEACTKETKRTGDTYVPFNTVAL